jgi:hypothetical protein
MPAAGARVVQRSWATSLEAALRLQAGDNTCKMLSIVELCCKDQPSALFKQKKLCVCSKMARLPSALHSIMQPHCTPPCTTARCTSQTMDTKLFDQLTSSARPACSALLAGCQPAVPAFTTASLLKMKQ